MTSTSVATVELEDNIDAQRVGKFMCVVPPKTLRVNPYGVASRAEPHTALDDALSALEFQTSSTSADGGGVAISVGPAIQAFTDNEIIVSFCGHLTNVDYLAWRLFSAEGRRGDSLSRQHASPLEAASALIGGRCYEAELVCHMYKTFGTKALPKLRGQFSFVCFDARSVRVFAARDPSGTYPLMYGRDQSGTVVVANFESAERVFAESTEGSVQKSFLKSVPAGCFIYGHRGITPQRFAKDEASAKKLISKTSDAVANALRGLRVGRRSLDGRKSTDGARRRSMDCAGAVASSPPTANTWSRTSGGKSRLPWRKDGLDEPTTGADEADGAEKKASPLDASAKPWSTGDLSLAQNDGETHSESSDHGETEPALDAERGATLAGLETDEAHDVLSDAARDSKALEPGTARDHAQAETVAVKAAVAALRRVASGANMKGMVRMGSSNALHALGMGRDTTKETPDTVSALSGLSSQRRSSGEEPHRARRVSGNSDATDASSEGGNMSIHRVPSRSGLISSMVKVASFGNLGGLQHVGSLNDLRHAAKEKRKKEGPEEGDDAEDDAEDAWADMSLLVISNAGGPPERE